MTVLAAHNWSSNADLIADVATLGYIGDHTIDLSYGHNGGFWNKYRPRALSTNDGDVEVNATHHVDVQRPDPDIIRLWAGCFQTSVWDGPYRLSGTRDRGDFDKTYGLTIPRDTAEVLQLLADGCTFAHHITQPSGHILVKCQDQVVSGRKVWQTRILADHVEQLGARLVDQFHLTRPPRPQPPGRAQHHSRSNYSTLLVFKKSK